MGCWCGAGPHSFQGNDVGRNRLSDLQTAVCSESLLIPGPGEKLEPAGESLRWGDPGEVWRGACRDRLEAAGPGLSLWDQGPISCPPPRPVFPLLLSMPCSLQELHELISTKALCISREEPPFRTPSVNWITQCSLVQCLPYIMEG